jgi:hypothetical protein
MMPLQHGSAQSMNNFQRIDDLGMSVEHKPQLCQNAVLEPMVD